MRALWLFLLIAGCWRGSAPAAQSEPEPLVQRGAPCEEVAGNARRVIAAGDDAQLAKRADALGDIIERRCDADDWSIELRRCVAGAKLLDDADLCRKLATQAQQDAVARDLEAYDVGEVGE